MPKIVLVGPLTDAADAGSDDHILGIGFIRRCHMHDEMRHFRVLGQGRID